MFTDEIRTIASGSRSRQQPAGSIPIAIKGHGQYSWVGVYDVQAELVSIIAWSGPGAPVFPAFPVTQGLTSAAITQKSAGRCQRCDR